MSRETPVGLVDMPPVRVVEDDAAWPGDGCVWPYLQAALTLGASEEWQEYGPVRRCFRHLTFPLLMPVYLLMRATIPRADPDCYSRTWLLLSLAMSGPAVLTYLEMWGRVAVVLPLIVTGLVAAVALSMCTRDQDRDEPPRLSFGTRHSFGPPLFALLGFVLGVMWIDTLASEVVGILSLVSALTQIPAGLVGLTLLAWGNSLGDLFGNTAMAKQGHSSIAISACFAGPLFNMLVSLALGFSAYLATHDGAARVHLSPELGLGCVFLVIYGLIMMVAGAVNGWQIPASFITFARAWYALYLVLAVFCGMLEHWDLLGGGDID